MVVSIRNQNIQFPNLSEIYANMEGIKNAELTNRRNKTILDQNDQNLALESQLAPKVAEGDYQGATQLAGQAGNLPQTMAMQQAGAQQAGAQRTMSKENLDILMKAAEYLSPTLTDIAKVQDPNERSTMVQHTIEQLAPHMDPIIPNWSKLNLAVLGNGDPARLEVAANAGLKLIDKLKLNRDTSNDQFSQGLEQQKFGLEQQKFGEGQNQNLVGNEFKAQELGLKSQELAQQKAYQEGQLRNGELTARGQNTGNALQMRKQFEMLPEFISYKAVAPMVESVRKASRTNTKAADLNVIYGIAKMMDPNSVVRESEQGLILDATGPAQKFVGMFNTIAAGGSGLSARTKKELLTEFDSRWKGIEDNYKNAEKNYTGITQRAGLNVEDVVTPPMAVSAPNTGGATGDFSVPPEVQKLKTPKNIMDTAKKYGKTPEQVQQDMMKKYGGGR